MDNSNTGANNNSKEEPTGTTASTAVVVVEDPPSQNNNNKRGRSDSHATNEDPPAKRIMRTSSPRGGGPPLMPMDLEPQKQEDTPVPPPTQDTPSSKKTRLTPPTARAPAPVVPPRSEGSPSTTAVVNDPPKKPSGTPPLQPKTTTTTRSTTTTTPGRKGTGNVDTSTPKSLKGLRHFSMMVCKKVEEKQQTTYNEVADELVKTVMEVRRREEPNGKFDEKNIRRRVYDSINVLLAMDIIAKDKKQISWKGLPSTAQHDLQLLQREEEARKQQVQNKRKALQEILLQQISFRNLVTRNKEREMETLHAEKVPLPFIVVNTHKEAIIHCNMAPDLTNVMFEYDRPFEINDDNSILTRLGMHKATVSTLREMVPEDLVTYCQEHGLLDSVLSESETKPPKVLGLTTEGCNKGQYFRSIS